MGVNKDYRSSNNLVHIIHKDQETRLVMRLQILCIILVGIFCVVQVQGKKNRSKNKSIGKAIGKALSKKLNEKFNKKKKADDHFTYNSWNKWRQADGMLCRNDNDCNWVDEDLKCMSYNVTIRTQTLKMIDQDWFGGQVLSVVGECHCSSTDKIWDDEDFVCAGAATLLLAFVPLVLGLLVNLNSL